jgi:hypothetical protein
VACDCVARGDGGLELDDALVVQILPPIDRIDSKFSKIQEG